MIVKEEIGRRHWAVHVTRLRGNHPFWMRWIDSPDCETDKSDHIKPLKSSAKELEDK